MKNKNIFIIIGGVILAIVIAAGGYFILGRTAKTGFNTVVVAPAALTETVTMNGKVKAAAEVDLAFERGGRVVSVPVSAGGVVKRGALLASLDASDAQTAAAQADAALSAAQIALEKMKRPPEAIDLLKAQDAVAASQDANAKAATDLGSAYDGAYSVVSDTFLDLQTALAGLHDILHNSDLNPGQDNIDYYADLINHTDPTAAANDRLSAESSYQAAAASLAGAYADFKAAGAAPDKTTVTKLLTETYATDKLASDAIKSAGNLLDLYAADLTKNDALHPVTISPVVTAARAALSGYAAQANGHFAALSGAQTQIQAAVNNVAAMARALSESQTALTKLQAGAEDIDLAAQQTRVDAAAAAAQAAHDALAKTALRAPFDGTVSSVNVSVGEMAGAGVPAVAMVSNSNYEIDAFVSEADVAKVAVGQQATVTLDAYGAGSSFAAAVVAIDPAETTVGNVGAYGFKLQFVGNDPRIKSGMTANISLVAAARQNALSVPASAIITRGTGKFVLVDTGAKTPTETAVTVGLATADGRVEIISGLKAGDKVVTFGNGN